MINDLISSHFIVPELGEFELETLFVQYCLDTKTCASLEQPDACKVILVVGIVIMNLAFWTKDYGLKKPVYNSGGQSHQEGCWYSGPVCRFPCLEEAEPTTFI